MSPATGNALKALSTPTRCGRDHDLTKHGRRDPKSGRLICRECQRVRLADKGHTAGSFSMPTELLAGLDIEADRMLISRNKLLAMLVKDFLERQWEERR